MSMFAQFPRILQCELVVTNDCNGACRYCFESHRDGLELLSHSHALAAIDAMVSWSRDSEWFGIVFIGGEPLLDFDLICDVVFYAQKQAKEVGKQVVFTMTTNGSLLEEKHCRFFQENRVRYTLSLDGGPEDNDRYRIMANGQSQYSIVAKKMRMLKRYQHWQGARMTVMPDTAARLCQNVRHLHEELAINQFILGFATNVEWSDQAISDYAQGLMETFEYYLEQRATNPLRRLRIALLEVGQVEEAYEAGISCAWGCGAGSGRVAVASDGTLHGCAKLAFAHIDRDRLITLGSVESGFNKKINRLRLLNRKTKCRPKCELCPIQRRCNGGCYAANIIDTGDLYTPADYYCKLVFAQIQAVDYARRRLRDLGFDNLYWNHNVQALSSKTNYG